MISFIGTRIDIALYLLSASVAFVINANLPGLFLLLCAGWVAAFQRRGRGEP